MLSLREMGMPWRGPRSRCPLRPRGAQSSDSAFLACVRARSAVAVIYAFSLGLSRSMRASISLASSTGKFAVAEKFSDFLDGCEGKLGVVHAYHIKSQPKIPDWISWETQGPR